MTGIRRKEFQRHEERRKVSVHVTSDRRRQDRRQGDLAWISLFCDADYDAVTQALAGCDVLEVPAGTPLLIPGQPNHNIYIPLSGVVEANLDSDFYSDAENNADSVIALSPGECVGELSAIDGKPVSALVITRSDARILRISSHVFWDRLMILPSIARNLRVMLSERMRRTNEIALKAQRKQLELQHLKKELDVARRLQASMVPLQRPLFPDRQDIEACGFMEPAASVGGDFFDAFFVRDDLLFFCIGDVSGHGIVSALFMARAIGLIRVLAVATTDPSLLLKELNHRLCAGNEADIFVTLFCGFLDTATGMLAYSNGGHCAPMLVTYAGSQPLPLPKGPLVGAFPNINYGLLTCVLEPGDTLFCYTDGVTEAQTEAGEEFSEERCLDLLQGANAQPVPAVLDAIRASVALFSGKVMLDDDCTMFSVRIRQ